MYGYLRERKRWDYGLKSKVFTMDIRIKELGLTVIHSKVPSSELKTLEWWISRLMLDLFFLICR